MKSKNILLMSALLATSLFSCSSDNDYVGDGFGSKPIEFETSVGNTPTTRASGTSWTPTDAIGVYMLPGGQILGTGTALGENKKHTTATADGKFAAEGADRLFFPQNGSNVDFIAYYPYQATITDHKAPIDVSNQANLEAIDLMYSNDAKGKNMSSPGVVLGFHHKLSNVVFNITDQSGNGLTGLSVKIEGLNTKSEFSLIDGTLAAASVPAAITANSKVVDPTHATAQAIVIPAQGINGGKVTFTIPSQSINTTWDIPAGQNFDGGNKYEFTVTVKSDGKVIVNPNSNITDWNTVPGGNIELGGGTPTVGDGTQSNPYTVDQVAAKAGESGKWVTGYIVGSKGSGFAIGTPSKTNILLAKTASETNEANCVVVDLSGSAVAEYLDIVSTPGLISRLVKVQGNIAAGVLGTVGLTAVSAQEGGEKPNIGGGDPEVYFSETFGAKSVTKVGGKWPFLDKYDDKDNKAPIVFNSSNVSVRSTTGCYSHMWFPNSNKESYCKIENIPSNYTNIKLSYDIAGNLHDGTGSVDVNVIKVKFDGQEVVVPSKVITGAEGYDKKFYHVTITSGIPNNFSTLEFYTDGNASEGMRLTNIKLEGIK